MVEYHRGVKQLKWVQIIPNMIWVQTVCKGYQLTDEVVTRSPRKSKKKLALPLHFHDDSFDKILYIKPH